ncbi:HoxN/HupN/NixA family nickel/cobalt transporter [Actinomadura barringtoniae]|uniref:Nickel/cobalt efflux system n=1 Tax=Actinomadura barringtoniae TaxID=1427535 RepID=A0A939T7D1_9ACTN|nr:HoxN/HupN/NixA family nickel/cobalt transporter [Actinomadura barringtoniae]MBO2445750.1 HoxN/HupN/NixA family nickel/cobalt transporter [Actinomadura barringtoniae]
MAGVATGNGLRGRLSSAEWRRVAGMAAFIAFLHLAGWGMLLLLVVPGDYHLGNGKIFGVGIGLTAYTLGMRHAFDADHLAAIDNTTRKLMTEGQRPVSVGFWFSLGHSSVVFVSCLLLGVGVKTLANGISDDESGLHTVTGTIGPTVSGTFLAIIATINLVILVGIVKIFREMKRGSYDEAALEDQLNNRGFMNRILGRFTKAITKPGQMYPLGFLFGLGFDTASEIGLLALAGSAAAASGLPWYAVLCLPIIFAAGMSLWDTIDGTFMNFAYGWAFSNPVRKIFYNITLTGISVVFAFVIGGTELLQVAQERFDLTGGFWDWIAALDLNIAGFIITGVLIVMWLGAMAFWRFGRVEQRWSAALRDPDPEAS